MRLFRVKHGNRHAANTLTTPTNLCSMYALIALERLRSTGVWLATVCLISHSTVKGFNWTLEDSLGEQNSLGSRVIVQLFGWQWADVAKECEWLGRNGYSAVQISPPHESVTGRTSGPEAEPWWQMYQPVSYTLNSRFGSETEFKDMVAACGGSGVDIYADAVLNHMASGDGIGDNGTVFTNRNFPGTYSPARFHHCNLDHSCNQPAGSNCQIGDFSAGNPYQEDGWVVQTCDLVGLPDLDQGDQQVQQTMVDYLNKLIAYGVKGFRLDAAKHIWHQYLEDIINQLDDPELFVYSEVIDYDRQEQVQPEQYLGFGSALEFRFAVDMYANFMEEGKIQYFQSLGEGWGYVPSNKSVPLVANHDTLRDDGMSNLLKYNGAPGQDPTEYKLATLFMLAYPYGTPKVFSGFYWTNKDARVPAECVHRDDGSLNCFWGNTWICEHRWMEIAGMAKWRSAIPPSADPQQWQNFLGGSVIAFSRNGQGLFVLNNAQQPFEGNVDTTLPPGTYRNILRDDGESQVVVSAGGRAWMRVAAKSAVAFLSDEFPQAKDENQLQAFTAGR